MSGWTDERVEQLKKLWLLGWSASQIAKELGAVTRNAVIGKIHRLDLVARQSPKMTPPSPLGSYKGGYTGSFMGAQKATAKAAYTGEITVKPATTAAASPYKSPGAAFAELAARGQNLGQGKSEGHSKTGSGNGGSFAPAFSAPTGKNASLAAGYGSYKTETPLNRAVGGFGAAGAKSLGRQCQWPVGDPRSAGFHFCGCAPLDAMPYCGEHAKLAYQPSATRRKVNVGSGDLHAAGTPDEREISIRA